MLEVPVICSACDNSYQYDPANAPAARNPIMQVRCRTCRYVQSLRIDRRKCYCCEDLVCQECRTVVEEDDLYCDGASCLEAKAKTKAEKRVRNEEPEVERKRLERSSLFGKDLFEQEDDCLELLMCLAL